MDEYIIKETAYPLATRQEVVCELIRCKDCKYRDKFKYCTYKTRLAWIAPDNDFCSKAERRTDEVD